MTRVEALEMEGDVLRRLNNAKQRLHDASEATTTVRDYRLLQANVRFLQVKHQEALAVLRDMPKERSTVPQIFMSLVEKEISPETFQRWLRSAQLEWQSQK